MNVILSHRHPSTGGGLFIEMLILVVVVVVVTLWRAFCVVSNKSTTAKGSAINSGNYKSQGELIN